MRRLLIILGCLLTTIAIEANPIKRQQAADIASKFFASRGKTLDQKMAAKPHIPVGNADATTPYYIYNAQGSKGFVIVSGDDRTPEILGYSDTDSFEEENMPENMKAWLQGYADQIEYIQKNNIQVSKTAETRAGADKATIEPMLKTTWDQGTPYNNLTPTINGIKSATGCVATALAQVLFYHYQQHPNRMPSKLLADIPSYTYEAVSGTQNIEGEAAGQTIDWANMLTDYSGSYSDEQASAVAKLMIFCGKALKMQYARKGDEESATGMTTYIPSAMVNLFGFDKSATLELRRNYTSQAWEDLIYNELANNRPVEYTGQKNYATNTQVGHAFVIDGYDGNGYFHFDWGWGGRYNGSFLLYYNEQGYNDAQEAIIHAEPDNGGTEHLYMPTIQVISQDKLNDFSTGTKYWNYVTAESCPITGKKLYLIMSGLYSGTSDETFYYDLGELDANGNIVPINKSISDGTNDGNYSVGYRLASLWHNEGTYQIYPIGKRSSDTQWHSLWPEGRAIQVIVSQDDTITVSVVPKAIDITTSLTSTSSLIEGMNSDITLTLTNAGTETYSGNVYVCYEDDLNDFYSLGSDMPTTLGFTQVSLAPSASQQMNVTWTPRHGGKNTLLLCTDLGGKTILSRLDANVLSTNKVYTNSEVIRVEAGKVDFSFRLLNSDEPNFTDPVRVSLCKNDEAKTVVQELLIDTLHLGNYDNVRDLSVSFKEVPSGTYIIKIETKTYPGGGEYTTLYTSGEFATGVLSITDIKASGTLMRGSNNITVSCQVKNLTDSEYTGNLYLNPVNKENNYRFTSYSLNGKDIQLQGQESKEVTFDWPYPDTGVYTLQICAEDQGKVILAESNDITITESRNIDARPFYLTTGIPSTSMSVDIYNSNYTESFNDKIYVVLSKENNGQYAKVQDDVVIDTLSIEPLQEKKLTLSLPTAEYGKYKVSVEYYMTPESTERTEAGSEEFTIEENHVSASDLAKPEVIYTQHDCQMSVAVKNDGSDTFTGHVYVFVTNNSDALSSFATPLFTSEELTVASGGSVVLPFSFNTEHRGQNTIWVTKDEKGRTILGKFENVFVTGSSYLIPDEDNYHGEWLSNTEGEASVKITLTNTNDDDFNDSLFVRIEKGSAYWTTGTLIKEMVLEPLLISAHGKGTINVSLNDLEAGYYKIYVRYRPYPIVDEDLYTAFEQQFSIELANGIVNIEANDGPLKVYNLQGQHIDTVLANKLSTLLKSLPKGIYIVNGRKISN